MKAVTFVNWTDQEFSWKWGGTEYSFPAHREMMLEEYLAEHFAKHLTDRELTKSGLAVDHFTRKSLLKKCFLQTDISSDDVTKLQTEILNASANQSSEVAPPKRFCETCDSKGVRHKKECPKYETFVQKGSDAK